MAEDYKLIDNEEKHRYEFQIDGKIAEIDYIKSNNGEIYLVHRKFKFRSSSQPFSLSSLTAFKLFLNKVNLFRCPH